MVLYFVKKTGYIGISLILPHSFILGWPCIAPLGSAETKPKENRNKMIVFIASTFQIDSG
jgi:hypothetical protein